MYPHCLFGMIYNKDLYLADVEHLHGQTNHSFWSGRTACDFRVNKAPLPSLLQGSKGQETGLEKPVWKYRPSIRICYWINLTYLLYSQIICFPLQAQLESAENKLQLLPTEAVMSQPRTDALSEEPGLSLIFLLSLSKNKGIIFSQSDKLSEVFWDHWNKSRTEHQLPGVTVWSWSLCHRSLGADPGLTLSITCIHCVSIQLWALWQKKELGRCPL